MKNYEIEKPIEPQEENGCKFCWDIKLEKQKRRLYFFDTANNLRACNYCPYCGKKYLAEED